MRKLDSRSIRTYAGLLILALAMPAAAAHADPDPEEIVSVTIDLPSDGGDGQGCSGFASLAVSTNTLTATLDEIRPGIANPTVVDRLNYFGLNLDSTHYDGNTQTTENLFTGDATSVTYSQFLDDYQTEVLDTDSDGDIDISDSSFLTLDYRVFKTQDLEVSFSASSCVDSDWLGSVDVTRGPVERREIIEGNGQVWVEAELDYLEDAQLQDFLVNDELGAGNAYLLRRTQIGGQTFTRRFAEQAGCQPFDGCNANIMSGSGGMTRLKAITRIFGDDAVGQYRTRFYFWMDVYPD